MLQVHRGGPCQLRLTGLRLCNSLIAGNNQFAQLAAGTVVGAIGKAFGTIVAATPDFDLESMPVDQIFGSFGVNVAGAALGSIASFLTAELGTALHLNGYDAQLFDSAVGSFAGSSDLQIAEDYERYLNNREVINALIAAEWKGGTHRLSTSVIPS